MSIEKPPHANFHCRHYSYEMGLKGGPRCALKIDLSAPGAAFPRCMPLDGKAPACDQREEYTEAERQAWREWRTESTRRMITIMAQIPGSSRDRANRPNWGERGQFDCPGCQTGKVSWSRSSYNGHLHAGCSTPDCFAVIE